MILIKRKTQPVWEKRVKGFTIVLSYGRPHHSRGQRWYLEMISHETGSRENYKYISKPTKSTIRKRCRFMRFIIRQNEYWNSI